MTVSGTRWPSSRRARSGTGSARSSAVFMSAAMCSIRSISGTFANRANLLFIRKLLPPSGASSIWDTTWPNVAAQVSNTSMPAACSRSGRRYRCITYASVTELAIGVAVANVTTRSPLRRRR